jgi:hypothetical protein
MVTNQTYIQAVKPEPLTEKEMQFLEVVLPFVGANNTFRFGRMRKAGVPEKTEEIFNSGSEWLDSQVSRKLQDLKKKGWIVMDDGLYTLLHRP